MITNLDHHFRNPREMSPREASEQRERLINAVLGEMPVTSTERSRLAEAMRYALVQFGEVTLGVTDGYEAADALDGISAAQDNE